MALSGITSDRARRRLAWVVPVVVVGGVAAGVALTAASPSGASPALKSRSVHQLLTAVAEHAGTPLSGEVHEMMNLGLPSLPDGQSAASLSWRSFLTGSHTIRVWVDGPNKQRVALLGQLSEADVVHNGNEVWTYTSDTNSVTRSIMGKHAVDSRSADHNGASPDRYTPAGVTAEVLKFVRPSTRVTVGRSQTVAGQGAYTLLLSPRNANSTVGEVRIAIDANRFVPLKVEIRGRNGGTVLSTGFTTISYASPPASTFNFHRPAGAASSGNPFTANGDRYHGDGGERGRYSYSPSPIGQAAPKIIGSGWTTVVELNGASVSQLAGGLVDQLTNPVGASGMRLLHTSLVNAVFTSDGRVFVGAVTPKFLEGVAAAHAH